MTDEEKKAVHTFCESLIKHDAWMWRATLTKLLNDEINFNAPATLTRFDEIHYEIKVKLHDGREPVLGFYDGGWAIDWIKPVEGWKGWDHENRDRS